MIMQRIGNVVVSPTWSMTPDTLTAAACWGGLRGMLKSPLYTKIWGYMEFTMLSIRETKLHTVLLKQHTLMQPVIG